MKKAFDRQLDALSTLWAEPGPNERVFFLGECEGRVLAVYYCTVSEIASLSKDWTLLKLPTGNHVLPRLRRITPFGPSQ